MKKIFLYSSAVMLLGAASCSQEEIQAPVENGGNVNLTVSLPGAPGSRAFADGLTAENLEMAVYDAETGNLVQTPAAVTFGNSLSTNVSLSLANGRAYKIAFFAHKAGGAYTFNADEANIKVDYTKMNADYNTDNHDCFYKLYETEVITGPVSHAITLTRPVAQVNWGTSDLANSTVEALYGTDCENLVSAVTAKAYTEFSLLDSDVVAASETEVTLPALARPASTEAFPVEPTTYEYLSMQYLLVPAAGTVSDIKLEISGGVAAPVAVNVTNAPLQANYRTNIFGALLTSPADFNVTKDENFGDNINLPQVVTPDMLVAGGNFVIRQETESIEIPASMEAPLTITVNAPVEKITLPASNDRAVSIVIGKDVAYPEFAFTAGSELKDLTIKGDPTSTESFKGFVFQAQGAGKMPVTHTVKPKTLENLVLDGLRFDNGSFAPQYQVNTKNITVRNCVFLNSTGPAVAIQHAQGGSDETAEGITIENCTIEFAADASKNQNGLYLLDISGDIIVRNNTIKNATAHGVSISCGFERDGVTIARASKIEVTGNNISGKIRDGIKIENEIEATLNVSDNTIAVTENGIRIKGCIAGLNCTITGNTIDMANAIAWNEGDQEPWAILLINATENTTPSLLNVTGNTFTNSNGHDLSIKNVNKADGSTVQ